MNTILKAYKYRLYPTEEQKILLAQHFGCVRFVFNHFLNVRKLAYETNQQSVSYNDTAKLLTELKQNIDFSWLKTVNSQSLQQSLLHLDAAYTNFFRRIKNKAKPGYPKFKNKHSKQSFSVPQNFSIQNNCLRLPKIGLIPLVLHRMIPSIAKLKACTVSKSTTDKYFVSILAEEPRPETIVKQNITSFDLGLAHFIVQNNGIKTSAPKYYPKYQKQLKRLQKQLSRKTNGSSNRKKSRLKLAVCYEKIVNQRTDFLHKLSHKLVSENQAIGCESLAVQNMVKNHSLAKRIQAASWSTFIQYLKYKTDWYGTELYQVDRYFPSSQLCSNCGYRHTELKLSDRQWMCPTCAAVHDRDINAAKNIQQKLMQHLGTK